MEKITIRIEEGKHTPETLAMERILAHYGPFYSPGKARRNPKKKVTEVPILADIPIKITEDETEKQIINFINVGEIGNIFFSYEEPYKLLYAPPLNSIFKQIRINIDKMRVNIENDLIKSSKFHFGKIESIKHPWLSPLIKITNLIIDNLGNNIYEYGIAYSNLLQFGGEKQIDLMINSNLVKKINTDYGIRIIPTDVFKILLKEANSEKWANCKKEDLFIGYVIQNQYDALITRHNQNTLKSMVRTSIGIYEPSAFVGHGILLTEKSWIDNIKKRYNFSKKHIWNIKLNHIPQLLSAGIVEKEKRRKNIYYKPNEEIFEAFCKEAREHLKLRDAQPLESYA